MTLVLQIFAKFVDNKSPFWFIEYSFCTLHIWNIRICMRNMQMTFYRILKNKA